MGINGVWTIATRKFKTKEIKKHIASQSLGTLMIPTFPLFLLNAEY